MIADELQNWGKMLADMCQDGALIARACDANEWFTASAVQRALSAMLRWFEDDQLNQLRIQYPEIKVQRSIGLILAGNLPMVGLHDVLMVLLSGHHAVVKPSHKDSVLLKYLLDHSAPSLRTRVSLVETIDPKQIDFLIATGSNATAIQIENAFAEVPHVIRKSRFSIAVLEGDEDHQALVGLADDVLSYHGMGCRSVACILVPEEMDLTNLLHVLDHHEPHTFSQTWSDVVRYERARLAMTAWTMLPCAKLVVIQVNEVKSAGIGVLNIVRYQNAAQVTDLLSAATGQIQCIVGRNRIAFGESQFPRLSDFADGVDTLQALTQLY